MKKQTGFTLVEFGHFGRSGLSRSLWKPAMKRPKRNAWPTGRSPADVSAQRAVGYTAEFGSFFGRGNERKQRE